MFVCRGEYLFESVAEALEGSLHVAALLHGDDAAVVLLVHPHQEVLVLVVPAVGRGKYSEQLILS